MKSVIRVVCVLVVAVLLLSTGWKAEAKEFSSVMDKSKLWDMDSAWFDSKVRPMGFVWLSKTKKDAAHHLRSRSKSRLEFLGHDILETYVRFKDDKINQVYISLYNRGDAGELEEKAFEERLEKISKSIDDWAGEEGVRHKPRKVAKSNLIYKGWVKGDYYSLVLKWSTTESKGKYRPEFINLEIVPFTKKNDPRKSSYVPPELTTQKRHTLRYSECKNLIKTKDDGDVYVSGIPMIDQGPKGYCVVATAERVLRLYEIDVDQHMLAEIANTGTSGGTSVGAMFKAVSKAGSKFGVKTKAFLGWDWKDFQKEVKNYNRLAKKKKAKQINMGREINVFYKSLDPVIFKELRCVKGKRDMDKFYKTIKQYIDQGIPILWTCQLGFVKEPLRTSQTGGGHMRMIIGYNEKNNEIVFSDSWGSRHEYKKLSVEDAWTETTGYAVMYPRDR